MFKDLFRRRRAETPVHTVPFPEGNAELTAELREWRRCNFWPAGHFYSPSTDPEEVRKRAPTIFDRTVRDLPGIDMRPDAQRRLLDDLAPFVVDLPFPEEPTDGVRYCYNNDQYGYGDALFLFCMLRHLKPSRIVEVGSGYSSAIMLDTMDRFFDEPASCTFIEPYPQRLKSLLSESDASNVEIAEVPVQDVPIDPFLQLESGDLLFIDSTHVSKTGSDVNRLLFEVLPRLQQGVYVHIHDILYPFEYPEQWVYEGRGWNEAYALRAFLQFNSAFEICAFNTYMVAAFPEWFAEHAPRCLETPGGSLWLRRRSD